MVQDLQVRGNNSPAAEQFAWLLDAFAASGQSADNTAVPTIARLRTLLADFQRHQQRADESEQAQTSRSRAQFVHLLHDYRAAFEHYRITQEQTADDFNLLDVMNLTGSEIRHSMVLAWLLDHNIAKLGTHAQGNLGFRLFLEKCDLPVCYADCKYWVRREVAGDESIVDLEVASRGKFLIHIENKIWSSEGAAQTDREWYDLCRRAADLSVDLAHMHGLFLTPHGTRAKNPNFRSVTWGRIAELLEEFAERAKPPDVRLFGAHYARVLRRFTAIQSDSGALHVETTAE